MVVFPNAKINLGLHITEKRPDGYHNIESVFYPIPVSDVLEITENQGDKTNFKALGIDIPSDGKPNLVEQAWSLVNSIHPIPFVDLELLKNIPIGAGLGGGSSDAAFCIRGLNELFNLKMSEETILQLAGELGADCAFFVKNQPVYAEGIGDIFSRTKVNLKGKHILLIYPNIHVSTPIAYKHVIPRKPENDIREVLQQPIETWKNKLVNNFEASVFKEFPRIKEIKNKLYEEGALYASMSGSGSSIFGIFNSEPKFKLPENIQHWSIQL